MRARSPCKGCTDRSVECHTVCGKYCEYAAVVAQLREERKIAKTREDDFYAIMQRSTMSRRKSNRGRSQKWTAK